MLLAEKNQKQLEYLDKVINDEDRWYSDRFRVMNNEAASGKSRQTFESIAKLATDTDNKIIYIQMFANENSEKQDAKELKNTVDEINSHCKEKLANYLCSENRKLHKQILSESKIICITHKKYLKLCTDSPKGNFITDADVLIIDEFPNLYQSFFVTEVDLVRLQGFGLLTTQEKQYIEELNIWFKDKLNGLHKSFGKEMHVVNLHKQDVKKFVKVLNTLIDNAAKNNVVAYEDIIESAKKILEIFSHTAVYYIAKVGKTYPALYSFYKDVDYILASQCNIILDANGGFDERYKLRSDIFNLDKQSKVFDYSDSKIVLYPIATTKNALQGYKNIIVDVAEYIDNQDHEVGFHKTNNHLIVTDILREKQITDFQKETYDLMYNVSIAHFGALIGKNNWKKYNNIWIIKTPFFQFIDYILQYCFYSKEDLNGNTNCQLKKVKGEYNNYQIFRNKDFNKFKNSIVLGEYYQACKRIARDGRKCTFNILTSDESLFDLLVMEFKNVKNTVKTDLEIHEYIKKEKKKSGKEPTKTNDRRKIIEEYLSSAKAKGENKVEKSEICKIADLRKDKLSKTLKKIDTIKFTIGTGKEQSYIIL